VAITFLQHTDGSLPHYSNSAWTFARGATATIDRDLGFIDTHLFHDIIGTHVCHHLVSTIPFYHAGEASIAIRKVMGGDYRADENMGITGSMGLMNFMGVPAFMTAFWKNMRSCRFVEESVEGSGVYFFRNLHGKGAAPKDLTDGKAREVKAVMEARERRGSVGAMATAMSSSRNMNAKRRLSHGINVPTTLPLLAE
jgi:omega-6 fatty acid desaturase / acyl-lipid omega-6 desaturase (Delta-12 desaturase)